jgi:apolipoprotein N-acyltransferase
MPIKGKLTRFSSRPKNQNPTKKNQPLLFDIPQKTAFMRHRKIFIKKKTQGNASTVRYMLAFLSGMLLTAGFPPIGNGFIAWFALVPLLKCLEGATPSKAFKLGLFTGLVHNLSLLYWIVFVVNHYGNLNIYLSVGPLFLLCFYLALYPACFSLLTRLTRDSLFAPFFSACFWVGLEYVRAHFMTGFPWCLLGYTQHSFLTIIQVADICGVYGLSFLIVLTNGFIYTMVSENSLNKRLRITWAFTMLLVSMVGTLAYGRYCLSSEVKQGKRIKDVNAVIIQGNIDQSIKWNPEFQEKTVKTHIQLTKSSRAIKPHLVVWPETAVPFFFQEHGNYTSNVLSLAKDMGTTLIFGSPAYGKGPKGIHYYNRAYLISPFETESKYHDKVHLVPFGEYIPFGKLLFFINRLVPAAGDFQKGEKLTPLISGDLSIGILICFEVIFPELARAYAKENAHILVNLTNDAWFGKTSAPHQHLIMAKFRAVENRRPLIRAANTGISAFIDTNGEILSSSLLFEQKILKKKLAVNHPYSTLYARFGDFFAIFLLSISILKIGLWSWKKWASSGL